MVCGCSVWYESDDADARCPTCGGTGIKSRRGRAFAELASALERARVFGWEPATWVGFDSGLHVLLEKPGEPSRVFGAMGQGIALEIQAATVTRELRAFAAGLERGALLLRPTWM